MLTKILASDSKVSHEFPVNVDQIKNCLGVEAALRKMVHEKNYSKDPLDFFRSIAQESDDVRRYVYTVILQEISNEKKVTWAPEQNLMWYSAIEYGNDIVSLVKDEVIKHMLTTLCHESGVSWQKNVIDKLNEPNRNIINRILQNDQVFKVRLAENAREYYLQENKGTITPFSTEVQILDKYLYVQGRLGE